MTATAEQSSNRVVIVACGGAKAITEGSMKAGLLYTGSYHTACRKAADALGGTVYILSALHGLVPLEEDIETYDLKMGEPGSIDAGAVRQQADWFRILDADVTVLGGAEYVSVVQEVWPNAAAPLTGGIGKQLQQLAVMYGGNPEAVEDEPPAPHKPRHHYRGELRNIPGLPSRGRSQERRIWFGGKAGRGNSEPGRWTLAGICYTGEGEYDVYDLDTRASLLTCKLGTRIFYAYDGVPGPAAEEPAPEEPRVKIPDNIRYMMENADSAAARASWERIAERYR